jgi:hypothetical protein
MNDHIPSDQVVVAKVTVEDFLGKPPIDESDRAAYDHLHDEVHEAMAPMDAIERIWARDVVDLVWETHRLRSLKSKAMRAAQPQGLERALGFLKSGAADRRQLVRRWVSREEDAVEEVNRLLKNAGYDAAILEGETFLANLANVERIDRLIAQTEARRNSVFREMERRRDSIGYRRRREIDGDVAVTKEKPLTEDLEDRFKVYPE